MTEMALIPTEEREETVSPRDAKSWELVSRVLDWMREHGCYNYSAAFRAIIAEQDGPWKVGLEAMTSNFRRAMKNPYVQQRLVERYKALDLVVFQAIEKRWLGVIWNLLDIAVGDKGKPRDAVMAARFLEEQRLGILSRLESGEAQVGEHPALQALRNFQAARKQKVIARRVTEEVTISDDDNAPAEVSMETPNTIDA